MPASHAAVSLTLYGTFHVTVGVVARIHGDDADRVVRVFQDGCRVWQPLVLKDR